MKFRLSFVTNSSSSSYICDVCGNAETGMDICLSDAYMYECENGHTFCDSHLLEKPTKKVDLEDNEDEDEDEDERYGIDAIRCPICQFKAIKSEDALKFLTKKYKLDDSAILSQMKETYGSYKELQKDLK